MTAENNGTDAPEGDDPFAYLYRQDGGDGSTAQQQHANVPRRSYNQVRAVGERQYGGQQYGERPQPNAHYAAPETMPGGRAAARQGPPAPPPNGHGAHGGHGGGGRRGGGRNHNGLLIGALAVVAAVVIGIGTAVVFNNDGNAQDKAGGEPSKSPKQTQQQSSKDQAKQDPKALPKEDAAKLRLAGGPTTASDEPGAKAAGGTYVTGFNKPGAAATWTVKVDKPGQYRLYTQYATPGKDMHLSLAVNGRPHQTGMDMKNYMNTSDGDWKGWQNSWSLVQLNKGVNTLKLSCGDGDKCDVNLDQVWIGPPNGG
ncbi:carbohydrate-binding protein [Streptomyces sp. ODS28]|uniref:carbohydrate-binding protein n=1 Tax=Streptomyces sp. ODS28 TaxID=3136688 RepID=UPI0031F0E9E9